MNLNWEAIAVLCLILGGLFTLLQTLAVASLRYFVRNELHTWREDLRQEFASKETVELRLAPVTAALAHLTQQRSA